MSAMRGARYPVQAPACSFALDCPGDVVSVVRTRHRAEAAEWLALFAVFREGSDRPTVDAAGAFELEPGCARIEAAESACARWCVITPITVASARFRLWAVIQLFERLPETADGFLECLGSAQGVKQIVDRTYGVDPDLCDAVDAGIRELLVAEIAAGARFSAASIDAAVGEIVMAIDPDGVRTVHNAARDSCRVRLGSLPGGVVQLMAVAVGVGAVDLRVWPGLRRCLVAAAGGADVSVGARGPVVVDHHPAHPAGTR